MFSWLSGDTTVRTHEMTDPVESLAWTGAHKHEETSGLATE